MSRWPATSESRASEEAADQLIAALRRQPLLVVLRPRSPLHAAPLLERLQALGLHHVEIAWQSGGGAAWGRELSELVAAFPRLSLGVASVAELAALEAAVNAGCRYAVSPILERALQRRAAAAGIVLVPGVMSPTEVQRARRWGARLVKLFPAVSLGPGYWRRLREPLGGELPFVIAAGGLAPADVLPWLSAGVDAVALGSSLLDPEPLRTLIATLPAASAPRASAATLP